MLKVSFQKTYQMVDYNMINNKRFTFKFHNQDISKFSFLITGGAGFIGSNIVEYLLQYEAGKVRVLDNLSNGYFENIQKFTKNKNFEFIQGDIRDINTCYNALQEIDFVSHQAALGSVPRSIGDPVLTNEVNVSGFLNMLVASKNSKKVKNFVYAASSSTYGDSKKLPKVEGIEGNPLSPYAVSKYVNELYASVFMKVYGFKSIGLRYFNVFGPNQSAKNPYAAVIPIFCDNFINNKSPIIFGDGHTSRDFTFVDNVVQANIKALFSQNINDHMVFNVACGESISLNEIVKILNNYTNKKITPIYQDERKGDVKHSLASIELIKQKLNYLPQIFFSEGLKIVYEWYQDNSKV
jgi:UDP-N-acetylglucosamine 4-epimerase